MIYIEILFGLIIRTLPVEVNTASPPASSGDDPDFIVTNPSIESAKYERYPLPFLVHLSQRGLVNSAKVLPDAYNIARLRSHEIKLIPSILVALHDDKLKKLWGEDPSLPIPDNLTPSHALKEIRSEEVLQYHCIGGFASLAIQAIEI